MYQYLYVPRSTGVYPYVPVCMCTAGVWSSWTLELPVGPRVRLPWFKQIYIFKCCFLAHVTARAQKKFGFVLVELLLRSSCMRWALGDNNIIHCWDQWWEKCRVSWKKLQQKKRKSQRGDEEDKNSKGQTKSTHPQRVRTEDTEGRSSQALDQPPGRHRFSENLRSNGDVGCRHRTDLLHLQGLLQSQLLIGCLLLFLFVL